MVSMCLLSWQMRTGLIRGASTRTFKICCGRWLESASKLLWLPRIECNSVIARNRTALCALLHTKVLAMESQICLWTGDIDTPWVNMIIMRSLTQSGWPLRLTAHHHHGFSFPTEISLLQCGYCVTWVPTLGVGSLPKQVHILRGGAMWFHVLCAYLGWCRLSISYISCVGMFLFAIFLDLMVCCDREEDCVQLNGAHMYRSACL
jgi:hypothetical protein